MSMKILMAALAALLALSAALSALGLEGEKKGEAASR